MLKWEKDENTSPVSSNFLPKNVFFSLVLRSNLRLTLTTLFQFEIVRGLCACPAEVLASRGREV